LRMIWRDDSRTSARSRKGCLMKKMVAVTVLLLVVVVAGAATAHARVNVSVNIGIPVAVAPVPQPVVVAGYPDESPWTAVQPELVFDEPPRFIYSRNLGFHVSVGVPYDIAYVNNGYYLYRGGSWYLAPAYYGPWSMVSQRRLPPGLRNHRYEQIRQYRDYEYRSYMRDRDHYRGTWHQPHRVQRVEHRDWRKDNRIERKDHWKDRRDDRWDRRDGRRDNRRDGRDDRKHDGRDYGRGR